MGDLNDYARACKKQEEAIAAVNRLSSRLTSVATAVRDSWTMVQVEAESFRMPGHGGTVTVGPTDWPALKDIVEAIRAAQAAHAEAKSAYETLPADQQKYVKDPQLGWKGR